MPATYNIPKTMKALTLVRGDEHMDNVWHYAKLVDLPTPIPDAGQVLVKIHAAAFNHRDIWIRRGMYGNVLFSKDDVASIFGSDGVGTVVSSHPTLYHKKVLIAPMINWNSNPIAPDVPGQPFGILGNEKQSKGRGTFAEYIVVPSNLLVPCPVHLYTEKNWAGAAALPLSALTAYRALFTKGQVREGQNVLITGIGGGTALMALQLAVAVGANVYVTSGSSYKIQRAKSLGAVLGVNYKMEDWSQQLKRLLPESRPFLDVVIDSAGGNIAQKVSPLLKVGGILVNYGMTTGYPVEIDMSFVIRNQEFRGCTMGSFTEFKRAIGLVDKYKIYPVVSHVSTSLDQYEDGFALLKDGIQFGKVSMLINSTDELPPLLPSNL